MHEVLERIYHSQSLGIIQQTKRTPRATPSKYVRTEIYRDKSVYYQNPETKVVFYRSRRAGGSYLNPLFTSFAYSASYKRREQRLPDKTRRPYNPVWHRCNSSSVRGGVSGRGGPLHHSLEWGPFHLLLVPSLNRTASWGSTRGMTVVKVKDEGR